MVDREEKREHSTMGRPLATYRGHIGPVGTVAWSSDGTRLASGGGSLSSAGTDHTVQVWDMTSATPLLIYHGHTDPILSLAWSPDNTRLASASWDRTVQVWDAARGRNLITHRESKNGLLSVAWSPDSRTLAAAGYDGKVFGWDAETGRTQFTYLIGTWVTALAWSPDGTHLAAADDSCRVQVFALTDTGDNALLYRGHINEVWGVAWSPDGKHLASGSHASRENDLVQVWRFAHDAPYEVRRLHADTGQDEQIWGIAWSQDGQQTMKSSYRILERMS